uniref:Uncharacterized protein n=1 Tax=uncultured bacterium contig00004 TaxID=1181496 RepID=A0A806KJH0_9BACT|nr:hypothetical protein [uncultured bacterium contig00004]
MDGIIGTIVDYISRIGDLFGSYTGLQIGGPIVTGVIIIVIALILWKHIPGWLKLVLVIAAVVMLCGGFANVIQTVKDAANTVKDAASGIIPEGIISD